MKALGQMSLNRATTTLLQTANVFPADAISLGCDNQFPRPMGPVFKQSPASLIRSSVDETGGSDIRTRGMSGFPQSDKAQFLVY